MRDILMRRPLAAIAVATGIRDFFLGLGLTFGLGGIRGTLIYEDFNELWPVVSVSAIGILFLLVGLWVMYFAYTNKNNRARVGMRAQAGLWMFTALLYLLNGHWILAITYGMIFSFIAGYLAFYQKHGVDFS